MEWQWILCSMGLMFLLVPFFLFRKRRRILKKGVPVEATLIKSPQPAKGSNKDLLYLEYEIDKIQYQIPYTKKKRDEKQQEGEKVLLRYDPEHPELAVVEEMVLPPSFQAFPWIGLLLLFLFIILQILI